MFEIVGREEQVFEQWEQGVTLSNPCMKAGDEVVFRNSSGATCVMIAGASGVEVPNRLLQMTCNILVDLEQGKEQHSDCQTVFEVNPADKPDDYVYVDNTIRKEAQANGVGGGGELVVNISANEDYSEFSVDKTFDEVVKAIKDGTNAKAVFYDGEYVTHYFLASYSPDFATFSSTAHFNENAIGVNSLRMFSDGGVYVDYSEIYGHEDNPK